MDRRSFIKVGVAGASGLVVAGASPLAAASAASAPPIGPAAPPDMDAYLARVDAGLASIDAWSPSSVARGSRPDAEQLDTLGRKALKTMYMTAMFSDLPELAQQHPGMQSRLRKTLPIMDEAANGMTDWLASRSPEELARVQAALRDRQHPTMQVVEAIDEQAARVGVSRRRRLQVRAIATQADWRLRNQDPALLVQETLERVRRVSATDVKREAAEDLLAARAGEAIFWQEQLATAPIGGGPGTDPDSTRAKPRRSTAESGARLMGIGILTFGLGAAATAAGAFPLVFVATAGAILFVIGLVMLLVGLAIGDGRGSAHP
jgi:hypothetical protein